MEKGPFYLNLWLRWNFSEIKFGGQSLSRRLKNSGLRQRLRYSVIPCCKSVNSEMFGVLTFFQKNKWKRVDKKYSRICSFVFWKKRWLEKFISNLSDLYHKHHKCSEKQSNIFLYADSKPIAHLVNPFLIFTTCLAFKWQTIYLYYHIYAN